MGASLTLAPEKLAAFEALQVLSDARKPSIRTFREWIEEEFRIPDGPFKGRLFRVRRQPYAGLWIDQVDSGQFNRFASVGPTQSGKTLLCSVAITMYHLFEHGENVGFGVPDLRMAGDKWMQDIRPAIEISKYADLIPTKGPGSRGGKVDEITFLNGATLKFVSGGAKGAIGDKSRAGWTARVIVLTEVDGYDTASGASREADPITQLEARTRAFDAKKRIYMECTASIPTGRIWSEYTGGTASVILCPCPHCKEWVDPGQEDLVGWEKADNEIEAAQSAYFACPECDEPLTEGQRRVMNEQARLIHAGQSIENGKVVGDMPKTNTLGFRWSAWHNMFAKVGTLATDSWHAEREADSEGAQKKQNQFVWALPWEPPVVGMSSISVQSILTRGTGNDRLEAPLRTEHITIGVDVRKAEMHYVIVAWTKSTSQIIDYGIVDNDLDKPLELSLREGLRELKQAIIDPGWEDSTGRKIEASRILVDSGWQWDTIDATCAEFGGIWMPSKGFGGLERHKYTAPLKRGGIVTRLGECYHVSRAEHRRTFLVSIDSGYWKAWLFERLCTEIGQRGAMTLFRGSDSDHLQFARHVTSEKQVETPTGEIEWRLLSVHNHWLDAASLACVGGHLSGMRLFEEERKQKVVTNWFESIKRKAK